MTSTRYYYREYVCKCGKKVGVMIPLAEFERKPAPECECGKRMKKYNPHLTGGNSAPRFIGFAKSRNKWDRNDISTDNAGERDTFESFKSLEAQGKLSGKLKAESKYFSFEL